MTGPPTGRDVAVGELRAEVLKVVTVRLWWILLGLTGLLALGYCSLYAALAVYEADQRGLAAFGTFDEVGTVFHGGNSIVRVLALVLGVTVIGDEYRHGTLGTTYLAVPTRRPVLAAKALVVFGFGLLFGLLNQAVGVAVAAGFVLQTDGSLRLDAASTWRSLLLGVLSIGLWALFGLGLGILFRSLALPLMVGIGFAYLIEPVLSLLFFAQGWNVALNLLPSGATNAMLRVTNPVLLASPDPFPVWGAVLVLLGWCVTPAVIGMASSIRRDV